MREKIIRECKRAPKIETGLPTLNRRKDGVILTTEYIRDLIEEMGEEMQRILAPERLEG